VYKSCKDSAWLHSQCADIQQKAIRDFLESHALGKQCRFEDCLDLLSPGFPDNAKNCPGLCLSVECTSLQPEAQMSVTSHKAQVKSHKAQGFEAAMAELEQIVADMEAGKLSLEDSLAAYKRGADLLSFCRSKLEDAQQQVRVLEDGVLKDFSASGEAGQNN
jgi:exodeoxyribonuclease VII small subunit